MNALVVAPILLPLGALVALILLRAHPRAVAAVSTVAGGLLVLVGAALVAAVSDGTILTGSMGGWRAPYGIALVIDRLSAVMVLVAALIGFSTILYGQAQPIEAPMRRDFHLFVQGLLAGVCGTFVTGDVFNLYVWFEVLMIGSFALISLGGGARRIAGTVIYLFLNLFATLLFLLAAGLLYGSAGSLNLAELALRFADGSAPPAATVAVTVLLVAFAIKAALFPVFGWLPASYHVAWTPVSALFAGLLTKVGVYALIRIMTLFWPQGSHGHEVLLWVACFTMVVGVLGAAAQNEVRRILSFHVISQVGYMVLGLALATPLALAGSVFYLIHHIVVKTNLFFIGGLASALTGSERLVAMGGLYARAPLLAVLFAIAALSLAGIPPLSGFWGKLLLIRASLDAAAWWAAAAALVTGLFTLLSMSKIWNEAFLKPHPDAAAQRPRAVVRAPALWVVIALAATTVLIGLGAGPVTEYALAAGAQLADPAAYVAAVLGRGGR